VRFEATTSQWNRLGSSSLLSLHQLADEWTGGIYALVRMSAVMLKSSPSDDRTI